VDEHDAIIVGGGPAGLSCALVLGRCRRRAVVIDAGKPRNRRAVSSHGLFTRDGMPPAELLAIGREEIARYDIPVVDDAVTRIERSGELWRVETATHDAFTSRRIVLATGMTDVLPDVPGIDALFGKAVHVCPYCDGWENRDRRLASWTRAATAEKALGLLTWSRDVVLFTDGERVDPELRARLARHDVTIHEEKVARLEHRSEELVAVVLASGTRIERDAIFVQLGERQASPFAVEVGCALGPNATVCAGRGERTGVPGVWVVGDASHDLQFLAVAVAEGVKAACAINTELREERYP
jgi:thioredoxin reductase